MKKLFLFALLFLATPALADDHPHNTFMPQEALIKNQATIDRIAHYLSSLTTIIADFTQVAPDGSLTSGKFFLARPGHMRWQYNPPTPILMVADGKQLVFYDYQLQQVTYVSLDDTLIGFLAQDVISFDGMVGITGIEKQADVIRVTMAMHEKPNDGSLMLEFTDKPLQIRNMVITDATNQVTTVSLNNAQYDVPLDKKLFVFNDPRKPRQHK